MHASTIPILNGYGLSGDDKRAARDQVEGSGTGSLGFLRIQMEPGDVNRAPRWCAPQSAATEIGKCGSALGGRRQKIGFQISWSACWKMSRGQAIIARKSLSR